VLVMQWLAPADHRCGSSDCGRARPTGTAQAVGRTLARIHAFAAARPELAAQFDTDRIFFDIRLEPYLLATAAAPDLAPRAARAGRADAGPPARWCTAT
jgi:hypothetical protein